MRLKSLASLVGTSLAIVLAASSALFADYNPSWNKPLKPYRVISNIYYVGTNYLASYLIVTPAGNILINPSFEESVPLIRDSVEKLGFHFSDVKIILISHAHDDHAAGSALAKKLSGGKLMVMDADAAEVEAAGVGDFFYHQHWAPVKVDRVLHDGDKVSLGGVTLTAHLTPGHTKGCTTWTTEVTDQGKVEHVVVVGSPNVNEGFKLVDNAKYPQIASDYAKTFRVLKALPCDVFLGAHGVYYDMDAKMNKMQGAAQNVFIDPAGYKAYVIDREQAFQQELAKQQAAGKHAPIK
jgi:metallo-beta-lactamase class B